MRITYRSSIFNSFDSNDKVVVLDESSISSDTKSLDQNRLVDSNDSYLSMLGLPQERNAHRSINFEEL